MTATDHPQRSGMGYKQMGDRGPFRFLVTSVSGQSNQRSQDHWEGRLPTKNRVSIALKMAASTLRRSSAYLGAQFRRLRTKLGAPIASQGHGGQVGPIGVPHAALRDEVRRPRGGVLRGPTAQPTDQTPKVESCQARISSCRSSCNLRRGEFLGSEKQIPQLTENTEKSKQGMELLESGGPRPRQARCFRFFTLGIHGRTSRGRDFGMPS